MTSNGNENKIGVGVSDKIVVVKIPDILYCEAQGNYTDVVLTDGKKIVVSKTLGDLESQFVNKNFFRIHHAYLINMKRVKEFQRNEGGYVVMENNIKTGSVTTEAKGFFRCDQQFCDLNLVRHSL